MLWLFPNLLADLESHRDYLPKSVDVAVAKLTGLIAEHEKQGRRFLRRFIFEPPKTFRDIPIRQLNEHSTDADKRKLIEEIKQGGCWGMVSDCGMPCLADPGADLVLMARREGIEVETFSGPSSILFAIVLSGLGGQHFTFHGYLPKEETALVHHLKQIEKVKQKMNEIAGMSSNSNASCKCCCFNSINHHASVDKRGLFFWKTPSAIKA